MLEGIGGPPDQGAITTPRSGAEHRELMLDVRNTATFGVMVRDTARGSVREVLGRPQVRYDLHPADAARFKRGFEAVAEIFWAAEARAVVVPLRGVPHRIVHWSNVRGTTSSTAGPDGEPIIAVASEAPHVARRVKEFLQREARRDLSVAVKHYTEALGVPARRITVRDTKSRWGSCSASGSLNFSWRLILAPAFVLDYLAAHEVAHLKEMNHSHRFWRTVHKLCPRTEDAERWLKRHGSELHKFG
jgi:hypothetical protein